MKTFLLSVLSLILTVDMRIAIMQPYFFPYIGYFQMIGAVDNFIFLEDVAFIKKGWINRNKIILHGAEHLFSIPVMHSSQNKTIAETSISYEHDWKRKFYKTLHAAYKEARYFEIVSEMIYSILNAQPLTINSLAQQSILTTCNYLGLQTKFFKSSDTEYRSNQKGEDRIIDICMKANATEYLNLPGGITLYTKEKFAQHSINLLFLNPSKIPYQQASETFIWGMSIIDVIMHNSPDETRELLNQYSFN